MSNEIQNFHIIILYQLWNHKYKEAMIPGSLLWPQKIGIHE